MHTAMIQLRLLYGLKKDVEKVEPKRVHEKVSLCLAARP